MIGAVAGRPAETGLLPLLREAALPLALFSGVAHGGAAVVVGFMVVGVVPAGVGGVVLPIWSVLSLLVSLVGYRRMEERRRREAVSALAVSGMPRLASAVIALYPRPLEEPAIAEVFELYRQAQRSLEEGDYRGAGEAVERGIALADGIIAGGKMPIRGEDEEGKGERSCK
ncbi:MAG: hypothetical protein CYG60_25980 [Actinobacteria bacterium]|nr:MAG: hypothetical protein CYG60_25980 [Actinomycetota bacterium]